MKATLMFATTLSMLLASPGAKGMSELEALRARCNQQEAQIQNLEKQLHGSKSVAAAPAKSTASPDQTGTHVVRSGESLDRIARRNGCSVSQLAEANGLRASSMIHPGQRLKLPGSANAAASSSLEVTQAAPQSKPAVSKYAGKTHTVRQGETYYSISRKYKMSIASLMDANPKVKATSLRPGLVLKLTKDSLSKPASPAPASTPQLATRTAYPEAKPTSPALGKMATPAPTARTEVKRTSSMPVIAETPRSAHRETLPVTTESKPAPAPPTPAAATPEPAPQPVAQAKQESSAATPASLSNTPNPEKKVRSVTVDNEMTYGDFAASHGTDTSRLNDLNGLDLTHATVLAKGSELYVPAQP